MDGNETTTANASPASAYASAAEAVRDKSKDIDVSVDPAEALKDMLDEANKLEIEIPVFGESEVAAEVSAVVIAEVASDATAEVASDVTAEVAADMNFEVPADATAEVAADMNFEVPADATAEVPADATGEIPAEVRAEDTTNGLPDTAAQSVAKAVLEASVTEKPVDGIEILIKLAESGDIDPKNIDIIDVTDKFLRAIAAAPKENLRQSGRIIFHASVLLRMKAEALLAVASAELDMGGDDFIDFDEDMLAMDTDQPRQITLKDLEKALVRRTNNKQNRQRKVTLQQLIDALKEAEKLEKERLEKKPRQRIQTDGYIDVRDVEDILELAHDEDIEVTIAKVDRLLEESIKVGDALTLLKLIKMLGPKSDWVDAFLAILFLSNAGKIILEQEEFYGPVQIIRAEEVAFGQAFKVTGVDHTTPEQNQQALERAQPPKPRKKKVAPIESQIPIEIPTPTDNVINQ